MPLLLMYHILKTILYYWFDGLIIVYTGNLKKQYFNIRQHINIMLLGLFPILKAILYYSFYVSNLIKGCSIMYHVSNQD